MISVVAVRRLLCGAVLCLLSACSDASFAIVNAPTYFDDTTVVHDVSYGDADWQKLDIYQPAGKADKEYDVVVFFYGGRWEFGSKDDYKFVGSALASQGFVVVIPDYSKYPKVRFPVFVQDGAKALSWTYDHIDAYGGRSSRIHVAGHSAGAHIGALLTADAAYLRAEGKDRSKVIHDFVGLAGPYDFTPDEPDLQAMFAPPENYPAMQVTTFIDGKEPPMLLLYGDKDTDVKLPNLEKLVARIEEKGGCETSIIYPGVDHIGLVAGFSWVNPQDAPTLKDVTSYFRASQPPCRAKRGAANVTEQ